MFKIKGYLTFEYLNKKFKIAMKIAHFTKSELCLLNIQLYGIFYEILRALQYKNIAFKTP